MVLFYVVRYTLHDLTLFEVRIMTTLDFLFFEWFLLDYKIMRREISFYTKKKIKRQKGIYMMTSGMGPLRHSSFLSYSMSDMW